MMVLRCAKFGRDDFDLSRDHESCVLDWLSFVQVRASLAAERIIVIVLSVPYLFTPKLLVCK